MGTRRSGNYRYYLNSYKIFVFFTQNIFMLSISFALKNATLAIFLTNWFVFIMAAYCAYCNIEPGDST